MRVRPGVDLVEVAQVAESIESFGARYLQRVHTADELAHSAAWAAPRRAEHLAGRFAAKEAVVKALAVPADLTFSWHDVRISNQDGHPAVQLGGALRDWAAHNGVAHVDVSITHDRGMAVAFAIAQPEWPTVHPNKEEA